MSVALDKLFKQIDEMTDCSVFWGHDWLDRYTDMEVKDSDENDYHYYVDGKYLKPSEIDRLALKDIITKAYTIGYEETKEEMIFGPKYWYQIDKLGNRVYIGDFVERDRTINTGAADYIGKVIGLGFNKFIVETNYGIANWSWNLVEKYEEDTKDKIIEDLFHAMSTHGEEDDYADAVKYFDRIAEYIHDHEW